MAYSRIQLVPDSGSGMGIDLNVERDGWVGQIIGGSFGTNTEYNFTGNVATAVTDKPIDINVRLTPTVPIPRKPARDYLDVLSSSRNLTVTLREEKLFAPSIDYKFNETTTYTRPTIRFDRPVYWKQACVVREIKYNYSENPATIEFTVTTKSPVLYGSEIDIYMGFGNQNWLQSLSNTQMIYDQLYVKLGNFDISLLQIGLPPVGDTKYQIFNGGLTQFHAMVQGSSTANNGFFEMKKSDIGGRLFNITGGYQPLSSTCYASEAYPAFPITDVATFTRSLRQPAKFNIPNRGDAYVKMTLQMVRKGL